jgi:hypothetical protein
MYSLSIDYLFNRIYDVLLWIKYTWFFTILRTDPEKYIASVKYRDWDGLRDRGWFDDYFAQMHVIIPPADVKISLWQRMLESLGIKLQDSDGDGIPDISDSSPYDGENLTKAELKERYQSDYDFFDHVRDIFGIGPKDSDKDGVPDSYEIKHGLDPNNPDTDHDGIHDGRELILGTDPLNPDSDGDLVLDGRDEAPLDAATSSISPDSDGDGVSDAVEKLLGTDIHKKDTDGDGIPDNMDTYPLDPNNIGQILPLDLGKRGEALHFSIQNPILAFFTDVLSVLTIIILCVFVYVSVRWFIVFLEELDHYDHHFGHDDHHDTKKHGIHVIVDKPKHETLPLGIANLPVLEDTPVVKPSVQDFEDHPKFAIIQGYMSSESEALWRIGIMEADNVLLETLTEKGYQGNGVAEKLKNASFKTIDLAWDAHKVRNRIAHDGSDFQLTEREAKRAFMLYESVFRDLKIIK